MDMKQSVEDRGRLVHHRNAQFEFSQYGTRSREPSPHIMRDRLTRYASPSRCYRREGDDIIPRIPQPYRTSFSAVTSPRRIQMVPLKGKSHSTLSDDSYTTPSRSNPPQQTRSCDVLSEPRRRSPTPERCPAAVETSSDEWKNKRRHILGGSKSSSDLLTPAHTPAPHQSRSCDNHVMCRHLSVENPGNDMGVVVVETKRHATVIQKEYVHAKHVIVDGKSHPVHDGKACEGHVENGKKKRSRSRLRNFAERTRESWKALSGGSSADTQKPPRKDAGRQPSTERAPLSQVDDKAPTISSSITRMLRRISHMSPKSLRKAGSRRSESCGRHGNGSEYSTTNSSSSSLHVPDVTDTTTHDATSGGATQKKSRKPSPIRQLLQQRFSSGRSLERNNANGKKKLPTMQQPSEQPPMPPQSARLLKTFDDGSGATSEKTVYQAFKEKQSNQRHTAPDTKPQAVRATCSPVITHHQAAPPCTSPTATQPVALPRKDGCEETTRRQHQPPSSLCVRDVTKMAKGVFLLSSMSVESIGQCSLDVHSIGSGTSLAPATQTDSVGQVTSASKYVLNSKAGDDTSTKSDTTEHPTSSSDVVIVAAAHGHTTVDSSTSSGTSSEHKGAAVIAPTAVVATPSPRIPAPATDVKTNGLVLHQNKATDGESDIVDSCHVAVKQNGVLPFVPHPPSSHKPDRRLSPREKQDSTVTAQPVAIVTNGALKSATEHIEHLTADGPCVSHNAEHLCDGNGEVAPLELTDTTRTAPPMTAEETACKDGVYFLKVMQHERSHLDPLCDVTERLLETAIPDEAAGKMRATVGKARLLTNKKFKQFDGLCRQQMEQKDNEKFKTTSQDLEGFWDMVLLQVDDVYSMFAEIETLRRNGWTHTEDATLRSTPSMLSDPGSVKSNKSSGVKVKLTKSKEGNSTRAAKKPSQQSSRNAQRDEARKRLLLAKRAGRQRKASHSETEVEIFVS